LLLPEKEMEEATQVLGRGGGAEELAIVRPYLEKNIVRKKLDFMTPLEQTNLLSRIAREMKKRNVRVVFAGR